MNNEQSESSVVGHSAEKQRQVVRERYANVVTDRAVCCDDDESTACCGESEHQRSRDPDQASLQKGYSEEELEAVAPGANLGLGCGNPTAIASLEQGETVLDLGSGAGFDCFLAAREVGEAGRVIGVDMTPEMIEKARENVDVNDVSNVEFRLGEIEHLPIPDETIDVIISNCVINLSPDKSQVYREAYRTLRYGGRLAISDVVLTTELPSDVQPDLDSIARCVGGASSIPALNEMLREVGFTDVSIEPEEESKEFIREWDAERDLSDYVVSASIEGRKPQNNSHH